MEALLPFSCQHCPCNARHLREWTYTNDVDKQEWAGELRTLFLKIVEEVNENGGIIPVQRAAQVKKNSTIEVPARGDTQCPVPERNEWQCGRLKKSKSPNLLERFRDQEKQSLRFMDERSVPYTNNQGAMIFG